MSVWTVCHVCGRPLL